MNQTELNKKKYLQFCTENKDVPLFLQPWWMDAVCKENARWEVFLYEEHDEVKGVFVCYFVSKMGLKMIIQPQLTQYNGVWLVHDNSATSNEKIQFEKKALSHLLLQLKNFKFDFFSQSFPPNFSNWLPFYWQGFSQTTRYTYQLDFTNPPEYYFKRFSHAKKKQIRKNEDNLLVNNELNGEEFYSHLANYHKSKGKKVFFSKETFLKIYNASKERNQGKIIAISDSKGNIHTALFVVWDKVRAYNLMSTIHPQFRSSGASTLVVYEAIKQMYKKVDFFDFGGSMEKDIENSISQFSAEQIPYFLIKKYNSILTKFTFPLLKL